MLLFHFTEHNCHQESSSCSHRSIRESLLSFDATKQPRFNKERSNATTAQSFRFIQRNFWWER